MQKEHAERRSLTWGALRMSKVLNSVVDTPVAAKLLIVRGDHSLVPSRLWCANLHRAQKLAGSDCTACLAYELSHEDPESRHKSRTGPSLTL